MYNTTENYPCRVENAKIEDGKEFYRGLQNDLSMDKLITKMGMDTWRDRYANGDEDSPQKSYVRVALAFCGGDMGLAQRMYNYVSKQWFMYSTPVYANGGTKKALPISCFLNYVHDSIDGITSHYTENAYLSVLGGGVGSYWGGVRSVGTKSSRGVTCSGVVPFMHVADAQALSFNQGDTRNASIAAYMDISHPEILEFLGMRKPTGGDINRKNLNLHHGVCVSDKFMEKVVHAMEGAGTDTVWELIDPSTKEVRGTVDVRELWETLIETRLSTGEPYIMFTDTVNEGMNKWQKALGLKIYQSNLCSEITLATGYDYDGDMRTAVCCLSSVNVATFDQWALDPQFLDDCIVFLDNVLQYFIDNAPVQMKNAVTSAIKERALGLGSMGFVSYLQRKMIPIESPMANSANHKIYSHIQTKCTAASKRLAAMRGEPKDMIGSGLRNSHLTAIAPNASSSILCGNVSPSVEPHSANIYSHRTLSGTYTVKNHELVVALERVGLNHEDVWAEILLDSGSVQNIDRIPQDIKDVFKTAREIDQRATVDMTADRQQYIDQSQSFNFFFHAGESLKYISDVHIRAWKKGVKTLYYVRTDAAKKGDTLGGHKRTTKNVVRKELANDECFYCQG